jgi:hypothetical protein
MNLNPGITYTPYNSAIKIGYTDPTWNNESIFSARWFASREKPTGYKPATEYFWPNGEWRAYAATTASDTSCEVVADPSAYFRSREELESALTTAGFVKMVGCDGR